MPLLDCLEHYYPRGHRISGQNPKAAAKIAALLNIDFKRLQKQS